MARFLVGFFAALISCVAVCCALFVASAGVISYRATLGSGWTAGILRERQAILDNRPVGPAIIVVAGSGGLFGVDAGILGKATELPVYNASTHAALPWSYLDHAVLSRVRRGDIVLLTLELEYFERPSDDFSTVAVQAGHAAGLDFFGILSLARKGEYLQQLSFGFLLTQLEALIQGSGPRPTIGYYGFRTEPNGDIDIASGVAKPEAVLALAASRVIPKEVHPRSGICASIRQLVDRGVTVIGTPAAVYLDPKNVEAYRAFLPKLRAYYVACGAKFLLDKTGGQRTLPDMLDTVYHLNAGGRTARTELLAQQMCKDGLVSCRR